MTMPKVFRIGAGAGAVLLLVLGASTLQAQKKLTLEQATARNAVDNGPSAEGMQVTVTGVVASKPIVFRDYTHLALTDATGAGLLLEAPDFMFEHVVPGDTLEVTGLMAQRDGMAVLRPVQLTTAGRTTPPVPQIVALDRARSPQFLGRVLTVEGRVIALSQDASGEYLVLGDGLSSYTVCLPRTANRLGAGLNRYLVGDAVRATGVAAMAFHRSGEGGQSLLEVSRAAGVTLLERSWLVSPQALLAGLLLLAILAAAWIRGRQRRMAVRLSVRRIHGFAEEMLTSGDGEEAVRKLRNLAPRALEAGTVEVYSYDRGNQCLRAVLSADRQPIPVQASRREDGAGPLSVLESESAAVALCFRNRTPLHIADTRRSPLFRHGAVDGVVRAIVLLPMFARKEMIGVLALTHADRPRRLALEELAALQHLANQISIVGQVLDRQARREQMLRTERLAATGQVISGVATELRPPIESILQLAHRLFEQNDPQARTLLGESLRAAAILNRYSQVARLEEATPVELNPIVERAVESVRRELGADLQFSLSLSAENLWVLASAAQMENVLRNVLLLAASAARVSLDRSLRIESALQSRRVMVNIRYGALLCDEEFPNDFKTGEQALGFSVCKGIVHGMGGGIRVLSAAENACRVEIELPAAFPAAPGPANANSGPEPGRVNQRVLTALILEPDPATQRRLISYWTAGRNRAVPVQNDAEALELMRRFRIDVIFCAVRFGAGNWVDFFDRVRPQVPVFVLVADAIDADASFFFPQGEGLLLRKPLETGEISRLLDRIAQRLEQVETLGPAETTPSA